MNVPHPLPALYWMWQQRSLDIRPWEDLRADLPLEGARIAIVGNAGYLGGQRQGATIDEHDLVVRMNNFRVTGFEDAVGSRVDVFLSNFYVPDIDFTNPDIRLARWIVSSRPNTFRKPKQHNLDLRYGEHLTDGLHRLGARRVYVPSLAYVLSVARTLRDTPTTGLMGLLLAVDVLLSRAASIYVTGFSFFEGKSHYFRDGTTDMSRHHNLSSEKDVLRTRLEPLVAGDRVRLDATVASHLGLA